MESKWLNNFEKEMTELKRKNKNGKIVIMILLPLMFIGMVSIVLLSGKMPKEAVKPLLFFCGVFILIIVLAFFLSLKSMKKDLAKSTRDSFNSLHLSDEQIKEFDNEMDSPEAEVKLSGAEKAFFLKDYLVTFEKYCGEPVYNFIPYFQISSNKTVKSSGEYMMELYGLDGTKIDFLRIDGKKKLQKFEDTLKKYCK